MLQIRCLVAPLACLFTSLMMGPLAGQLPVEYPTPAPRMLSPSGVPSNRILPPLLPPQPSLGDGLLPKGQPAHLTVVVMPDRDTLEYQWYGYRSIRNDEDAHAKGVSPEGAPFREHTQGVALRSRIGQFEVRTVAGVQVPVDVLGERLSKPTAVVMCMDGAEVSPLIVSQLKDDTLILRMNKASSNQEQDLRPTTDEAQVPKEPYHY